jgi:hypothetical protein
MFCLLGQIHFFSITKPRLQPYAATFVRSKARDDSTLRLALKFFERSTLTRYRNNQSFESAFEGYYYLR